ncbi:MAG: uracil-DNA glycosylase [candidate division Zixibacteria bacterium CG_4_9_14_3_um_filter_46_8]|nr:MAG: uracil-DNA glycosylase [candidate division Zixibacteria bacterium CG_4_9_14_3_um_filter_46_8]
MTLEQFREKIENCQQCPLGKVRTKFVFGCGNPHAKLMLIGEAPGRDEDLQGIPFVGRAGHLLDKILKSVNFTREEVYIANILKCRPPENRDPEPEEVQQCFPYLSKQIEMIKPQIICCLGRIAAQFLLGAKSTLGRLRENDYQYDDVRVFVTYHPAALLRSEQYKRPTWEDMKRLRRYYLKINNLPEEKFG